MMTKIKKSLIVHEKKIIVSISILSIVAVVGLFNRVNLSDSQNVAAVESNSRQPANFSLGTTNLEDSKAKELSVKSLDSRAQLGQDPSKVEQLTFGFLEGKYAVRLKDGKLNGLEFSPTSDQPKLMPNLEGFIAENREILPVNFQSVQRTQNLNVNQENVQKFSLRGAAQRQMAEVEFHLDSLGRLISMKINNHL
jgi:hypothetical protein